MAYFATVIFDTPISCFNANDGGVILSSNGSAFPPFTYRWLSGGPVNVVSNLTTPSTTIPSDFVWQSFNPTLNGIIDSAQFYCQVGSLPYQGLVQVWEGRGLLTTPASTHVLDLPAGFSGLVTVDMLSAPYVIIGQEMTLTFLAITGSMEIGVQNGGSYTDGVAGGPGIVTGDDLVFSVDMIENIPTNLVSTQPSPTGLRPGKYSLILEDNNGDFGFGGVYVSEPPELLIAPLSVNNPSNPIAFDGSVDINVIGGTPPYLYRWTNGSTTQNVSGLGNGTFTVEVTDGNACTTTMDFLLTSSLSSGDIEACPGKVIEPRLLISRGENGQFLTILDQDYSRVLNFQINETTLDRLAEMIVGGTDSPGSMIVRGKECRDAICLDGEVASIVAGCEFMNGEILVRDARNHDMIRLDGESGSIFLGGNTIDGDLRIYTADGDLNAPVQNAAFHFSAFTGDLELNGNLLDGGKIILRKQGDDAIIVDAERAEIEITNADFAEDFDIAPATEVGTVQPGTVMVFAPDGQLRPCIRPNDSKVAGIISGAGDFKPGIIMDKRRDGSHRLPVALAGKAFCFVETLDHAITPGDLLTTSHVKGHARKVVNPVESIGAVIGKALKGMEKGQTGLIPVKVGLM